MTTYEPTTGTIVHIELMGDDIDAARTFYKAVFDWEIVVDEQMDYTMWQAPNAPTGAFVEAAEWPFTPPSTMFYVNVDDLEATTAAVTDAGGKLLIEETEIPETGRFIVFEAPGGVVEAAWETTSDREPTEGDAPTYTDEPAPNSLVHFEFYSEDPEATRAFHERVFDWRFEDIGEGAYTMAYPPTPPNGGLMEANETMPAGTLAYLLVPDAADACEEIEAAGGSIVREPFTVEGWGTMAVFEAPGGITQAIWEATESEDTEPEPEAHRTA